MKFLLLFLLVLNSYAGVEKPIAPNCDQIVEEMDDSALLVALLVKMHEERVVSKEDLERFYENLMKGKLINPVPHEKGVYGPVITSGKELVFYKTFQALIESNHQINHEVVIQQLKKINQGIDKSRVERKDIQKDTNANWDLKFIANLEKMNTDRLMSLPFNIIRNVGDSKKFNNGLNYVSDRLSMINNEVADSGDFKIKYDFDPNEQFDALIARLRVHPGEMSWSISNDTKIYFRLPDEKLERLYIELMDIQGTEHLLNELLDKLGARASDRFIEKIIKKIISEVKINRGFPGILRYVKFIKGQGGDHGAKLLKRIRTFDVSNFDAAIIEVFYGLDGNYEQFEKALLSLEGEDWEELLKDDYFIQEILQRKDVAKFFKISLNHTNEEVRDGALEALSKFRVRHYDDKETIPLVQNIWDGHLFREADMNVKVKTLAGIDEPWAWPLITRLHDTLPGKLYGNEKLIEILNGATSRESRDIIDRFFEKNVEINNKVSLLKSRSKEDLYYFLEKYKLKKSDIADEAIKELFYRFGESSKEFNELVKVFLRKNEMDSSFMVDFINSLDKVEAIQFHNELMELEIKFHKKEPAWGSSALYLTANLLELRSEIYSYVTWLVKNEVALGVSQTMYGILYFLAFEKIYSQDPTEAALARKIVDEFDVGLFSR